MAATKSNTPKTKNKISDIASMFGGMAKMKKVRTPKRLKQKALEEEEDLLRQKMEALKHVEDSKKNRFAHHLSSQNVFDFALRKSPRPHKDGNHRQPSPMPPLSILPNDIVTAITSTSASFSSSASESDDTHSPQHNKIKHRSHRSTKIQKHKHANHNRILPVQNGIDLNAMRAKLRPIGNHNNEDTFGDDEEEEHMIGIEENPTPQSTANDVKHIPILNKERSASWSSNKSNDEDTEIDDILSTRSNSINEITADPDYNEWLSASDDASSLSSSNSASSSTMSSGTDTDTVYDELFGDNVQIGAIETPKFTQLQSNEAKERKRASWELPLYTQPPSNPSPPKQRSKHHRISLKRKRADTATSRMAMKKRKKWNCDELFGRGVQIGAIKTPKFNKADYLQKKKEENVVPKRGRRKRSMTQSNRKQIETRKRTVSAVTKRSWNYDELFGDSVQIGAIKTPKFHKESKAAAKAQEAKAKPKAINTEHAAAFDLSDILGDSFSFIKMNRKCDAIPESTLDGDLEEDGYCFDTHYSTDEEYSADTNTYGDDYYAIMMGDATPVTPNMPELPPLNAHNLSIDSEEESEAEAESESHLDKWMQILEESSDGEFEPPQPAKSAFEIEREEYDEIEKEIEDDMNREFELEEKQKRNRFQKKRDNEIAHDLDDMFGCSTDDDDEDSSSDSSSESPSEQHEVDRMTLLQLMCEYRLNPGRNNEFGALYAFFSEVLGIESASDLVNYAPTQITQPAICRATQTRMLLTKMAKYVTNQVLHNYWSGNEAVKWAELETNTISHTFQPQRSVKGEKKKKRNAISVNLRGMEHRIVRDIALGEEDSVMFTINEFPQINKKSKADFVINIGVEFYNADKICETVCISDRCSIRRNDKYVQSLSLSNSRMMESRSQVVVHCNNRVNEPSVTFSHLRDDSLYRYNQKKVVLNSFEQMAPASSSKSFAKIYIEQAYGNGSYFITDPCV